MTFPEIVSRFQPGKATPKGVRTRCPTRKHEHGDVHPSLDIDRGENGKTLLKCWSRDCAPEEICSAVGLGVQDLFDQNSSAASSRPSGNGSNGQRTYATPEDAADSFAKWKQGTVERIYRWSDDWHRARIRLPDGGKTFCEVSRNCVGWLLKAPPRPHNLYRVSELPPDARIYVCEGEKACDAGWGIGLPCTTSGSSSSAASADWTPLAGRDLVILSDNDSAGARYGRAVAEILTRLNPSARVRFVYLPNLPDAGDLADFVDDHDGLDADELRTQIEAMADEAPKYQPVEAEQNQPGAILPAPVTADALLTENPELNPPIIEGLLREAELLNLISASKIGKSWLTLSLALSTVTGRPWLGRFPVERGNVLLIDNELHAGTLANRIRRVADVMGVDLVHYGPALHIEVLRGRLQSLTTMRPYFEAIEPRRYKLVILDAFYRFLPTGIDENSNADISGLYNILDAHAQRMRSAFVLVHHSSKGLQSEKAVTDVGSGAGAMSRATDTHLILRPHEEEGAVVVDAAVRSWQPILPFCLRWNFPLWEVDESLDPANLRKANGRRPKAQTEPDRKERQGVTTADFVLKYVKAEPQDKALIVARARQDGMTYRSAEERLTLAVADGLAHRWNPAKKTDPVRFATCKPDLLNEGVCDDR